MILKFHVHIFSLWSNPLVIRDWPTRAVSSRHGRSLPDAGQAAEPAEMCILLNVYDLVTLFLLQ